ncbi:helix-turn-helix transcriptional regulator [Georgenia faecalis]|uniref:Helix-turn-helix transcriptional regulator n=1 Tax=Georgenia faecalis TaxID=2483799 RepID=A0ABV9DAQ6_9MICO|nr:WYL domain-containing protein [Georgenia faecalis]
MAETTADRFTRLLSLIAYLGDHPGVPVTEVAEHFGVSPAQVLADVNLLWVSGTPGYLPDDLIDFAADELDRDVLTLTNPRGMDRPLRLGASEALALLVALRSLAALAGDGGSFDHAVVASTTAKLTEAAGSAAEAARAVDVHVAGEVPALAPARDALARRRRLRLRYVSAADVVSERDVDPLELLWDGSHWFLRAWCARVQDVRHFRLDRVLSSEVLAEPATAQPRAYAPDAEPDLADVDLVATLVLASRARWVAERYPVDAVEDLPDGSLRVTLRVADPAWLTNLVLGLGEDVLALDPPDLAAVVAGRARAALAAYSQLAQ